MTKKTGETSGTHSMKPQEKQRVIPKSGPLFEERDYLVSKEHVEAGSPADHSICGEEDPGVGLEFVVRKEE